MIEYINKQHKQFADKFGIDSIELNDICIKISNLPECDFYNEDDVLKE